MLIPPRKNIEKIFSVYQNKCAFHDCEKKIIDSDNHVNGNIIFAESNNKEHPRFNPDLTDEQMIDYTNLILFCDIHAYEVQWNSEQYSGLALQLKISDDLKNLATNHFEFSDETYENFLHHFIDYHDPNRFSNIEFLSLLHDDGASGNFYYDWDTKINSVIKPTKHYSGGKFRIVDYKRRIRENDKVVFYPKGSNNENGIQAKIEFKSKMRLEGNVPELSKGEYFIALLSSSDSKSKLEDLFFTVM